MRGRVDRSGDAGRHPFFYGWVMLGVAIAMAIATMPTQTIVVSLFNDSLRTALSIDVEELSRAYTIGTIAAAFPLPWVGRMADRYGLRVVTGIVCVACAGSVAMLTQVSALWQLMVAFFLMRFLGQGSLGMLAGHTIAMWFERKLGTTHAVLAIAGFAGGSALMPAPTAWLIQEYGYVTALLVLAGFVVALVLPLVVLVFRNTPEDIGQHLDGDARDDATHDVMHGGAPPPDDPAFTRGQAMGTRAYWILISIVSANGMIGTALLFHMQEMLRSAGLEGTETQTAVAIQPWPIAFGVSMLGLGWLVDRIPPRRLMPMAPTLMFASCVLCYGGVSGWVGEDAVVPIMASGMGVFGVAMGVGVAVGNPAVARYFGRTHHGAIRGTLTAASVAATGAGPWVAGKAYELADRSFSEILAGFALVALPLVVASCFLRPPTPPKDRDLSDPDPDEPDPVVV